MHYVSLSLPKQLSLAYFQHEDKILNICFISNCTQCFMILCLYTPPFSFLTNSLFNVGHRMQTPKRNLCIYLLIYPAKYSAWQAFNIFINIWTLGWDLLNLGFCDHYADPLSCFAEWHTMASAEGEVAFCWSPSVWVLCQSAEFIFRLLSQINAVIYTDFLQ